MLDGELAERARTVIEEIADAVSEPVEDPSLADGNAGRALFHGYLAEVWPCRGYDERARVLLDAAIDQLARVPMTASLYSGFCGVAWVVEHLQRRSFGITDDADDNNAGIDETLVELLDTSPWPTEFDLIRGLAGIGVYALERLPRPIAADCLARVVDRLAELATAGPDGAAWRTSPLHLMPETRAEYPDGHFDLGAAHGGPAVAVVLAGAHAAGIRSERAGPLLAEAMRWMLVKRLPADAPSMLPIFVAHGRALQPARAAWCYGDPGAALAWYTVATAVGEPRWEQAAVVTAQRAAARPSDDCGVVDAGLCHGAAGLAVLFDRLGQSTGNGGLEDAARRWYERTLAMREVGRGACGYRSHRREGWVADRSLLTGATGIGLALLQGISPARPEWHRILAGALPPLH